MSRDKSYLIMISVLLISMTTMFYLYYNNTEADSSTNHSDMVHQQLKENVQITTYKDNTIHRTEASKKMSERYAILMKQRQQNSAYKNKEKSISQYDTEDSNQFIQRIENEIEASKQLTENYTSPSYTLLNQNREEKVYIAKTKQNLAISTWK